MERSTDKASFYTPAAEWPRLPSRLRLGASSAIAVDQQDRIFALHRGKQPVLCFSRQGEFLFSWGDEEIELGHGLLIDSQGFVWITDLKRHQVLKFTLDGRLLLTIGTRGEAGEELDRFDKPTDVAIAPSGDIFVSDGYGNYRVMKFSPTGEFIKTWGSRGQNPCEFDTPHALALDPGGKLYVADRGNSRIQVFDFDGEFLAELRGLPAFDGLFCTPDGALYGATGRGNEVLKLGPTGEVLESYGGPRSTQADLDDFVVPAIGRFNVAHGVCVDRHGDLYVAEIRSRRIQKLVRGEK